jgi:hypothetical protein
LKALVIGWEVKNENSNEDNEEEEAAACDLRVAPKLSFLALRNMTGKSWVCYVLRVSVATAGNVTVAGAGAGGASAGAGAVDVDGAVADSDGDGEHWAYVYKIRRRYSDFSALAAALRSAGFSDDRVLSLLPSKNLKLLNSSNDALDTRSKALGKFLGGAVTKYNGTVAQQAQAQARAQKGAGAALTVAQLRSGLSMGMMMTVQAQRVVEDFLEVDVDAHKAKKPMGVAANDE